MKISQKTNSALFEDRCRIKTEEMPDPGKKISFNSTPHKKCDTILMQGTGTHKIKKKNTDPWIRFFNTHGSNAPVRHIL
jgi:hypothetical protein